jgi:hypothetical protein
MEWRRHIARYGDGWFPGEPWVKWTFLALFAVAALLRFWNLPGLPFTHDELSALMRLYPTLGETIQRGVIELDTHPPGVQVFEWAWTRLFGTSEAAVKFPFILLALIALFHLYRFAIAWTSAGTALVSTALLATLQYTVLYAQIARPYAIGFFTIALLADQITRFLAFNRRTNLVGSGVAALLSAYTHHFSFLLAGIMVLSVFPLLLREQRKPFLVMCVVSAAAYVPNLGIFAKQLALGGLGNWLPPPEATWPLTYLRWILHYSWSLMLVVGGAFAVGLLLAMKRAGARDPARWLLPLWGLAPLVIGYSYSVWRSPVLQYSLVLFSFPFLIQWFFLGFRAAPKWLVLATTSLFALTSTTTLILERQHYRVFADSPYAAMVRVAQNEVLRAGPEHTLVIFDAPRPQVEFHVMRHGLDRSTPISWPRQQDQNELLKQLADPMWTRVVLGTSNGCLEERVAQVRAQFPYLVLIEDHVEGQVHVFTRESSEIPIVDRTALRVLSPSHRAGVVDVNNTLTLWHDTIARTSAWDMVGHEFGISGTYTLVGPELHVEDLYEVEMDVSHIPAGTDLALVVELRDAQNELLLYRATPASVTAGTVVVALSPSWVGAEEAPLVLNVYAQNRTKGPARIHALRVFRRDQNPVRNALLAPVLRLGHLPTK